MSSSIRDLPVILWDPSGGLAEQDCACADVQPSPEVYWASGLETSEDDCACAEPQIRPILERQNDPAALWQAHREQYRAPLTQGYQAVFNSLGPAGVVVVNQQALVALDSYRQALPIGDAVSRQFADLGLLRPTGATPHPIFPHPETLTAWLHVTNACNLRCTYCYVTKAAEAMDEATGLAAVDAVVRSAKRNGFKAIKLKYAGGEATLNFRLIRLLHGYAQEQAAAHGLGLHEVILSNGVYLTPAMLDFVRDSGMRLMISLDDVGAEADAQRVFSNGRNSAPQVARNVDRALTHGIKPYLSITITRHNADRVAAAVAFALDRELLFNLNFYRDHGFGSDRGAFVAEDAQLIAGGRAALRVIEERLPRQSLITALLDRSNFAVPHDRPCGAGHSYLVIDHHGRVATCQMEIERSVTDVMAEDPLEVIRQHTAHFSNPSVEEKEGCRDCQWRYWCAGGCPLLTQRVTGRSIAQSPYCNVYKALFPELLRLEGLRLLKWHALPVA